MPMPILSSTQNTRALLPDSLRFVRSDVPDRITEPEIERLIRHRLLTVVDLRQDEERRRRPCPLIDRPEFRYLCMPVTGGDAVPRTPDEVPASYIRMADRQMERIVSTLLTAPTPALYFCNAGKDRTGVVSAILLRRLGYDRATIVKDYLQSADNLREMIELYVRRFPQIDREIITPQARYIEAFLDWLDAQPQNP